MIKVYGVSDDLIEIEGDIKEEFSLGLKESDETGVIICFSCGTLLKIKLEDEGMWRIYVLDKGLANVSHVQGMDSDDDYSDCVTIDSQEPIVWVVKGSAYNHKGRSVDLNQ